MKITCNGKPTYGNLYDDVIISIDVPYWVWDHPDFIKSIEDGYCRGERSGSVLSKNGEVLEWSI